MVPVRLAGGGLGLLAGERVGDHVMVTRSMTMDMATTSSMSRQAPLVRRAAAMAATFLPPSCGVCWTGPRCCRRRRLAFPPRRLHHPAFPPPEVTGSRCPGVLGASW